VRRERQNTLKLKMVGSGYSLKPVEMLAEGSHLGEGKTYKSHFSRRQIWSQKGAGGGNYHQRFLFKGDRQRPAAEAFLPAEGGQIISQEEEGKADKSPTQEGGRILKRKRYHGNARIELLHCAQPSRGGFSGWKSSLRKFEEKSL